MPELQGCQRPSPRRVSILMVSVCSRGQNIRSILTRSPEELRSSLVSLSCIGPVSSRQPPSNTAFHPSPFAFSPSLTLSCGRVAAFYNQVNPPDEPLLARLSVTFARALSGPNQKIASRRPSLRQPATRDDIKKKTRHREGIQFSKGPSPDPSMTRDPPLLVSTTPILWLMALAYGFAHEGWCERQGHKQFRRRDRGACEYQCRGLLDFASYPQHANRAATDFATIDFTAAE